MLLFVQIAPVYLSSCMNCGVGLLEISLYKQPVQHKELLLKVVYLSFHNLLLLTNVLFMLSLL